ncbi:unnamed protein product [Calypogeia fissa]
MEKEDAGDSTSEWNLDKELELDDILRFERRLKALRWRERAEAANFAASTLVKDGHLRNFSSKEGPESSHVANVYGNLLRQLLHGLARHDSNWQVRVAAVDSATTILTAAKTLIPVDTFSEFVWVVLAACLDVQPEVQKTACNCVLQRLLDPSSHESEVLVLRLCDSFVEASIGADSLPLKSAKLSPKSEMTGLDNIPNGEVLLAGVTAAIGLHLLPLPASDMVMRPAKPELDRIPLLLVAVVVALEDANRRQSRIIAEGLSKLLRSLGKSFYWQSLLAMFNVRGPVYLSGPDLARSYQNAGIINEDTANVVKTIRIVTILEGLALAFEASQADEIWGDVFVSNNRSGAQSTLELPDGEKVALQQMIEMLQVPEELTKTLKGQDMESKALEFTKSAVSLLKISTAIIKNRNLVTQDQLLSEEKVEDFLLCCATFAGGNGEYEATAMWTSTELRDLSLNLLASLSDVVHPVGDTKVSNGRKSLSDTNITSLILENLSSVLPRIKQIIQDSSGNTGSDEILLKLSPEGTLGSSIVAANQMRWILSQLEHPNLGPHCKLVMPCVLTALDHFSPDVKRQAMRTCIHLAQNMNPTELRWYRDVTLDAVARSIVGCGDLWPVAVKMAVTMVTRIEGKNLRGSWCGGIFTEMLEELARQRDEPSRRSVWLQEISPYMEVMGLFLVAHFRKLLPLLFYWLHASDDQTRLLTLSKLQTVITYTWPRIPAHVDRIWKEMMHAYQDSINRKASPDIQAAVIEICKLLYSCAGPTFEAVWQQDEAEESIEGLVAAMKQFTTIQA